jgi:signal transduction histidine kinase
MGHRAGRTRPKHSGEQRDADPRGDRARRATAQLREEESPRAAAIVARERQRIAQELHDRTAQSLAAAVLDLARAIQLLDQSDGGVRAMLAEAHALCLESLEDIRSVSYNLQPPLLAASGLGAAVRSYVELFARRTGLRVDVDVPGDLPRFTPGAERALFAAAQEALVNIHRHSKSLEARVRVRCADGVAMVEIADGGCGLHPDRQGLVPLGRGIEGMRERVRACGGRLEVESGCTGTTVRATVRVDAVGSAEPPASRSPVRLLAGRSGP